GQPDRERPVDRPQRLLGDAVAPIRLFLRRPAASRVAEMLLQLGAGSTLDQPLPQPIDQPVRAGQLLRPLILPEQLIDRLDRDLPAAHQDLLPGRPARSLRPRLRREPHDRAGQTSRIHRNPRTTTWPAPATVTPHG